MSSSSGCTAKCFAKRNELRRKKHNNAFFNHRLRPHTCHPEGRAFCAPKDLNVHITTN
jgi:hypothetical protein